MGTGFVCTVLFTIKLCTQAYIMRKVEKVADECDIETIFYWKWSLKCKKFVCTVSQKYILSHTDGRKWAEGIPELGAEKDIWT
jgi:hypothetical protein